MKTVYLWKEFWKCRAHKRRFLLFSFVTALMFFSTLTSYTNVSGHVPPWTITAFAFISVSPSQVLVGQQVNIGFWLNQTPPTATPEGGDRWVNLTITITMPDGSNQVLGPFISNTSGGGNVTFTPTILGTYTCIFRFLGQVITGSAGTGKPGINTDYVNDYFLSSTSQPAKFVALQTLPTPTPVFNPTPTAPGLSPPGSTNVIGILHSDTIWTRANSPYGLTGPVAIDTGVTLTIEAGATVFLNGYYIQVNGTLTAKGTASSPVLIQNGLLRFTPASNGWSNKTISGCVIEFANLSWVTVSAANAIKLDQDSIADSTVSVGSSSIITNNIIDSGVIVGDSSTLSHNSIAGGVNAGNNCSLTYNTVDASGVSAGEYSVIVSNSVQGGVLAGNSSTILSNTIRGGGVQGGVISNNTIFNNFGNYKVQGSTVSNNNITGATVTATSRITENFIVSGNYSSDFRVFGGYATYTESTPAISGSGSSYISGNTIIGGGTFTSAFIWTSSTSIVPAIDISDGGQAKIINNNIIGTSGLAIKGNTATIANNIVKGDLTTAGSISNNNIIGSIISYGSNTTIAANSVSGNITVGTPNWNISGNTVQGIIITGGFGYVLDNSITNSRGISVTTASATIENNFISGNSTYGFINGTFVGNSFGVIIVNSTGMILNNTISGNDAGIILNNPTALTTINYNNFLSNKQNIYLQQGTTSNVNATFNWWGTTDAQAINQSIFDNKRDFNLGTVIFIPFLNSANQQAIPNVQAAGSSSTTSSLQTPASSPSPKQSSSNSPTASITPSPSSSYSDTQASDLPAQSSTSLAQPQSSTYGSTTNPQVPELSFWTIALMFFVLAIIALVSTRKSRRR